MDDDLRHAALGLNNKRSAEALAEIGNRKHWKDGIVPYVINRRDTCMLNYFNILKCFSCVCCFSVKTT